MSLSLLFPLGLLALAAWLIPLLVHLARRHQYAPLEFAALRWLRAKVRPRQRIRFDEWPLLLMRLLLLGALALLLARPVLQGGAADTHAVMVVAPGLAGTALRGQDRDGDWRWLAPGFPALQDPAPVSAQPLASLLRELDQTLPAGAPLTVYVPDPMPGLDGQRVQLSRPLTWRPVATPPSSAATPVAAPQWQLGRADADAQRVLGALQQAWSRTPLAPARAGDALPGEGQIGVWLSAEPLPVAWRDWLQAGGRVLVAAEDTTPGAAWQTLLRDADGHVLLQQRPQGQGQQLRFSAALSSHTLPALRDPALPRQLLEVLRPTPAPQLAAAASHVPLRGAAAPVMSARDLSPWLLLLIVLLFAVERVMATSPRRGAAA